MGICVKVGINIRFTDPFMCLYKCNVTSTHIKLQNDSKFDLINFWIVYVSQLTILLN